MTDEELSRFAERLAAIAPSIGDLLEADGEQPTPDPELPVLWLSSVGHAVAGALPGLTDAARRKIFGVVEEVMVSGTETLRTAVATGLLEALASDMDRSPALRGLAVPLLGTRSRAYLDAWDDFTLGGGDTP